MTIEFVNIFLFNKKNIFSVKIFEEQFYREGGEEAIIIDFVSLRWLAEAQCPRETLGAGWTPASGCWTQGSGQ